MRLDIDVVREITKEDASLIQRARRALLYLNREFVGRSPEGYPYHDIACAVVWPRQGDHAMRIDFKAVPANGGIGQAYLGPDVPLTEALFDGNEFTADFRRQMDESFAAFDAYLKEP